MKRYYKLLNIRALLSGFSALLLLASCSSYQYTGYDDDGIYSSTPEGEAYAADDYDESYENSLYYKQLFAEKSEQFAEVPEEGAIFTDIEGYTSTGNFEDVEFMEEGLDYQVGHAAWGSDPDQISINVYQDYNPFYHPYIYPHYAGFYDPFWGYDFFTYGYAYGPFYHGYGYGYPYHYGYGYHSPWRWRYGWNWGYPYYRNHYYYQPRQNVAYSATRRSSRSDYDVRSSRYDSDSYSRVRRYSNSNDVRAVRSNSDERTYATRSTRVRATSAPRRTAEYSDYSSRNVRRLESTSDRSNRTFRSARSSSPSPSYRSSSSSAPVRSSGTTSSTSRSSRGRGN